MSSITNVWYPDERRDELRKAVRHYHFQSLAAYFRICGDILCEHYAQKDNLTMPLQFASEIKTKKAK
jgi:hypothetical protein